MNEEESRQYYVQLQALHKHLEKLDEHLGEVEQKQATLTTMKEAVEHVQNESHELLTPVTDGIFMRAQATPKEFYLNVGAGIVVKKNPQDTILTLGKQSEELATYYKEVRGQKQQLQEQANALEEEIAEKIHVRKT